MRSKSWLPLLVVCLTILGSASVASAAVKLPALFTDNMVLQREHTIPVWGWADKGETVTITLGDEHVTAKAGEDGKWKATLTKKLEATPEGKSLEMTVKGSSGNTITLKNILVGEVWVCSGQSNMEMGIGIAKNSKAEIAAGDHPEIHLFTVPKVKATEPLEDVKSQWEVCTPKTLSTGGWGGFSAAAYYFGRDLQKELKVPVGLIHTSWGGTPAELWTSKPTLAANPAISSLAGQGENSRLYNGMIAPLIPFAIRGAIWYQGEANVGRGFQYRSLLAAMIRNWRTDWAEGDFPFGIVQIAPFKYGGDGIPCAELWEAELMTAKNVPHTGIALTMDIGEEHDIHPKNKQEVGRRLALWALGTVYGQKIVYSGPIYKSMAIEGSKIKIAFDHIGGGLMSRDGKPLTEFTIAGKDMKFKPAMAEIEGSEVAVHSDAVTNPTAVRFAWHDTAVPNLENKDGLPAAPFRTDVDPREAEQKAFSKMFGEMLAILGPAPKNLPQQFELKAGDKIVAIGDSITAAGGYLRDCDAILAAQYPELQLPKIDNVGIGGQKAEDLVGRFQKDVVAKKPAVVTLSIGINDVWHRLGAPHDTKVLANYTANVSKMVDMAQAAGIKVILLAPTVITEDVNAEGNKRLEMYVDAERKIASEKKCEFVDLHEMFLKVLAKKPASEKGNWLTGDGVHMKPLGDAIMAIGILEGLGVPEAKIKAADAPASK
jgi:sialate O-acetylesterase